jgi:hypothetical protein
MRLINATTFKVHEFLSDGNIPPYAILSHTWGDDECTLQQMDDPNVTKRKGYKKIQLCCEQALKDGPQWAWVDTYVVRKFKFNPSSLAFFSCCIDKTSTAELSEAINSMFRWYRQASVCYAYLSDVTEVTGISRSRWFTRGWTLQELVAPAIVRFYNSTWQCLGSKLGLREEIQEITNVEKDILSHGNIDTVCVARKMSWASNRQTTRVEDLAYCLMGIFNVNMPLLYGEGRKSFVRLQEAIMKESDDQSLFAWGLPARLRTTQEFLDTYSPSEPLFASYTHQMGGIFAESPSDFTFSDQIYVLEAFPSTFPPIVYNNGVRIELPLQRTLDTSVQFAAISCTAKDRYDCYLGIPFFQWSGRWLARCGELVVIAVTDLIGPRSDVPFSKPEVLLIKEPLPSQHRPTFNNVLKFWRVFDYYNNQYNLAEVRCSAHASYLPSKQTVTWPEGHDGLHTAFFYAPIDVGPNRMIDGIRESWRWESFKKASCTYEASVSNECHRVVRPPFAILIGGTRQNAWVEIVLILSDDDADDDFQQLQMASADLVQQCTTKGHLLSLFESDTPVGPLCGRRRQHEFRQIAHSSTTRIRNSRLVGSRGLFIDAQIQWLSSNLVERSLFLFVTIKQENNQEDDSWKPKWWEFKHQKHYTESSENREEISGIDE